MDKTTYQYLYVPAFKTYIFVLGRHYKITFASSWGEVECKFIKTTRKGFNLLDIKTNKCIFKQNMYSKRWAYMDIDESVDSFAIKINTHFIDSIVECKKKNEDLNAYETEQKEGIE